MQKLHLLLCLTFLLILSSVVVAEPAVNGDTISWPDNGWYQVQRTYVQGQNQVDWNLCNSNDDGTSCQVPNGTYTVQQQGGDPWRVLEKWDNIVVGSESSSYRQIFRDDFDGEVLSSNFYVPEWSVSGRDTKNNVNACSQSGGVLNLGINKVGGERQACYLISNVNNYGPGDNATMKIEYRANVSMVQARGAWFAGWVYSLGSNPSGQLNAEDADLSTGAEYDVFEYMPTNKDGFNVAIHDGLPEKFEKWTYPQGSYAIDLTQDEYHTYAIEWNKDCAVFSIDGNRVYKNTSYVSQAKAHSIMLTMEAETGMQWGLWDVGNFAENLDRDPAVGKIDWVKASIKESVDFDLCY